MPWNPAPEDAGTHEGVPDVEHGVYVNSPVTELIVTLPFLPSLRPAVPPLASAYVKGTSSGSTAFTKPPVDTPRDVFTQAFETVGGWLTGGLANTLISTQSGALLVIPSFTTS